VQRIAVHLYGASVLWYNGKTRIFIMDVKSGNSLLRYFREELNLPRQCSKYHLPLWQCPQFAFVVMGGLTVTAILVFYFMFSGAFDPYGVALISLALAGFLLVQGFIIVTAFERIAEASRMQAEFLNIASHQLRSPVTAARWALDYVTSDVSKGLSAEAQNCVHIARDAVGHIGQLVATILKLVRIESDARASMRAEAVPLRPLVEGMVASVRRYASAAHLLVKTQFPERTVFVRADSEQVRFVLERLLDNALQYTKKPTEVLIALTEDKGMARVEVRDRGEGIPDAEQAHVFERFFRASNAYLSSPDGTGLSLYVSRAIIEALGGKMGFSSTPGIGSTFWFTLPIVAMEPHSHE